MRTLFGLLIAAVVLVLSGCGYNAIQTQDEQVKASWSEVLNQYLRRADLVPNLVNTVKGYANQEKEVLTKVTEARAQVGSIQATPELLSDPQAFAKFESAQGQLTSSLSRLLVVSENYPQLKSDANFRDLQAQLEGTENRGTAGPYYFVILMEKCDGMAGTELVLDSACARRFPAHAAWRDGVWHGWEPSTAARAQFA
jgi:LemA protein